MAATYFQVVPKHHWEGNGGGEDEDKGAGERGKKGRRKTNVAKR